MENILALWQQGLSLYHQQTQETQFTNDRTKTIGSSDVGHCLRKSYLNKTESRPQPSTETLIIQQRGHLAEQIVSHGLRAAGIPFQEQVKIIHADDERMVAHIDFLIELESSYFILEIKTIRLPIEDIYPSWRHQVQFQRELLRSQHPAKPIHAGILALNINTGWHRYFSVVNNRLLNRETMQRAETLLLHLDHQIIPEPEIGLLCHSCEHKMDCPINADQTNGHELPEEIQSLIQEVKSLKEATKYKSEKESLLKEIMQTLHLSKIRLDDITASLSCREGKNQLDSKQLKSDHPGLYESYQTCSSPTTILKVA